jgi:hypothetical protein
MVLNLSLVKKLIGQVMKFILRIFIIPLATVAFITGCTSDGFVLGGNYLESNIRTTIIDTCTVRLTTVAIDSVATSGNSLGLVGHYYDANWGSVTTTTFVSYNKPSSIITTNNFKFDSVGLVMTLNGTYVGDTLRKHTINVYPLIDKMENLPNSRKYYSNKELKYDPTPMAAFSFMPRPLTKSTPADRPTPRWKNSFIVRLPDSFGEDLLTRIQDEDNEALSTSQKFRIYFPGFAVAAGDKENSIFGFKIDSDSSFAIRIYYHYSDQQRYKKTIDIKPDLERYFYGIKYDRSGTPFEALPEDTVELYSHDSGNKALVQALTATYIKVEIPYLNYLTELGDYCGVVSASLLLYPEEGSFSDSLELPKDLSIYINDENDISVGAVTTYSGDALQNGSLITNEMRKKDTYYSYDITSYMQDQLGATGYSKRYLKVVVPQESIGTTFSTVTVSDKKKLSEGTRLILKYLIYENE